MIEAAELNPHLSERLSRLRIPNAPQSDSNEQNQTIHLHNNVVRQYVSNSNAPIQGGPWLARTEVPTSAEILDLIDEDNDEVTIPVNKVEGGWESKEDYLSSHYDLLREDSIRPLREAVVRIRARPFEIEAFFSG